MAQKTVVSLIDDLDQSEADETVGFGLDGVSYEIDLSEKNAHMLRDVLSDYVETPVGRADGVVARRRLARPVDEARVAAEAPPRTASRTRPFGNGHAARA